MSTSPTRSSGQAPADADAASSIDIRLSPRRVCTALALIASGIIAAGIISDFLHHVLDRPWFFGLVPYFDLDLAHAVPSFVAALFIGVVALALLATGRVATGGGDAMARGWFVLGGIAAFMALDEGVGLHELLSRPTRTSLLDGGLLVAGGLLAALLVLALGATLFHRFLATLPSSTRRLLIAGAALYWIGALGIDLLSGVYASQNGSANLGYGLIVAVEEGLEFAGLIVALYGVLVFLQRRTTTFNLAIR